ncbi:aminopeptidase [Acidobacteriota bacterium]
MNQKNDLVNACLYALKNNLKLGTDEKVLIVTDETKSIIGDAFKDAALTLSRQVEMKEIPVLEFSGQEPPLDVALEMLRADVIVIALSSSLSWTNSRREASEKGARIVSMPGITVETVLRTFPQDYRPIRRRVNSLCDLLDNTGSVHITTEIGTDLTFSVRERKGRGRKGGIYTEKSAWGNLPCGEAFIAPVEGTANGLYFVDASHSGLGKIKEPVRIEVRQGNAIGMSGGSQSSQLWALLSRVGHSNAFNIAEFGLGCNDKAEICGVTLEDEKSLGTCHIALGGNAFFGGKTNVGIHLDGVLNKPTVIFDKTEIMNKGKLFF